MKNTPYSLGIICTVLAALSLNFAKPYDDEQFSEKKYDYVLKQ